MGFPVQKTVAKFFALSALDRKHAIAMSLRAMRELKSRGWMNENSASQWVRVLSKHSARYSAAVAPGGTAPALWQDGIDERPWRDFALSAEPEELEAVLFVYCLGINEETVADGLGVSVGTVRHRLGRGLRHLGGCLDARR